jgi:hypothetical protein
MNILSYVILEKGSFYHRNDDKRGKKNGLDAKML